MFSVALRGPHLVRQPTGSLFCLISFQHILQSLQTDFSSVFSFALCTSWVCRCWS